MDDLTHNLEPDLLAASGMHPDVLRRDLDRAWSNRDDAVDGEEVFRRLANKGKLQRD